MTNVKAWLDSAEAHEDGCCLFYDCCDGKYCDDGVECSCPPLVKKLRRMVERIATWHADSCGDDVRCYCRDIREELAAVLEGEDDD